MEPITRPKLTLLAVALATFMTYLDNNIVNVAMPAIQQDLHLTISGLEWVVSSYILVFASLLLAGGRLADVFGRKRLFLIGLGIFTVASLGRRPGRRRHEPGDQLARSRVSGRRWSRRPPSPSSRRPSPRPGSGRRRSASGVASGRSLSPSARCSAGCSASTRAGNGSSSSTCRSAWRRSCWARP